MRLCSLVISALFPLVPLLLFFFFFFFQAEDGIRDATVTGVQTCALPICEGFLTKELTRSIRNPSRRFLHPLNGAASPTLSLALAKAPKRDLKRLIRSADVVGSYLV